MTDTNQPVQPYVEMVTVELRDVKLSALAKLVELYPNARLDDGYVRISLEIPREEYNPHKMLPGAAEASLVVHYGDQLGMEIPGAIRALAAQANETRELNIAHGQALADAHEERLRRIQALLGVSVQE